MSEMSESSISTPPFVPTIVPIAGEQSPRAVATEENHEQNYKNAVREFDQRLFNFLETKTDFSCQIAKYINSHDNYMDKIEEFVRVNIKPDDKVLIVDFDNLAYQTIGRRGNSFTLNTEGNRYNSNFLVPNVSSNEMMDFKIAALLLFKYAKEHNFTNIIVVCKTPALQNFFISDYNTLKTTGQLDITKRNIEATFINEDLITYLDQIKCTAISVMSEGDFFRIEQQELAVFGFTDDVEYQRVSHNLKGADDSLIILISIVIRKLFADKQIYLMSNDQHMIMDFESSNHLIVPFGTKIIVNNNVFSEFAANFHKIRISPEWMSILQRVNFECIPINIPMILKYYYDTSELIRKADRSLGFNVKNWYTRNAPSSKQDGTTIPIKAIFNSQAPNDVGIYIDYVNAGQSVLNPRGKPHLSQNGNISLLEHNRIPYVIENCSQNSFDKSQYTCTYETPMNRTYRYEPYRDDKDRILQIKIGQKYGKDIYIDYCSWNSKTNQWEPALDSYGKPYINTFNGDIASIKNGSKWIRYLTMSGNPVLIRTESVDFYRGPDGRIDKIKVFNWQPYAKKYMSTDLKYYEKYLKYKAKYNSLKTKLKI